MELVKTFSNELHMKIDEKSLKTFPVNSSYLSKHRPLCALSFADHAVSKSNTKDTRMLKKKYARINPLMIRSALF